MLFFKGHGVVPVVTGEVQDYPTGKAMSASAACGFGPDEYYDTTDKLGTFSYLLPNAAAIPAKPGRTAALDALADQMIDNAPAEDGNSSIPPVFTYMGQFIDHDITANTDRETGLSVIDVEEVTPKPRDDVEKGLGNLRYASLGLDSVYGGAPMQGSFANALTAALRWRKDRAKMEAGTDENSSFPAIPLPADAARDLFRLGWARRSDQITDSDLAKVPPELEDVFFNADGSERVQRAIIGDGRNDENLAVAQFHLAMIRLHNEIVDAAPNTLPLHDRDAVYNWAKEKTQWTYQWLVMHAYLPAICDPATLDLVQNAEELVYNRFLAAHPPANTDTLPMPLEFSVAAFRFGHTMARASYDWSRNFGRGDAPLNRAATFQQLFEFTGSGMSQERLPQHWPIEWDRFVFPPTEEMPDRAARLIDTKLAPTLLDMDNEPEGYHAVMKNLPRRNLRRGYRLSLPSGQSCLAALAADHGISLPTLTPDQIASGHTAETVRAGGFETETPLWFYVLKEAEVIGEGQCLGPLGTFLVADTLIGLMRNDPKSYLNAAPGKHTWEPQHAVTPNGVLIDGMPGVMRAAGLL